MGEVIVKMTGDRIKVKGGEYVRDLVRCKECKHSPKNTKEIPLHDGCYTFNPNDYCSYGEHGKRE